MLWAGADRTAKIEKPAVQVATDLSSAKARTLGEGLSAKKGEEGARGVSA